MQTSSRSGKDVGVCKIYANDGSACAGDIPPVLAKMLSAEFTVGK
jgi:hypothetical protein